MHEESSNSLVLPGWSPNLAKAAFDKRFVHHTGDTLTVIHASLASVDHLQVQPHLKVTPLFVLYTPFKGDLVIGVIKFKSVESYHLDLNCGYEGTLGALQFDGATKRNKPNLLIGALVYCRVEEFCADIGAKVSCVTGGSKNNLGELKGGTTLAVNPLELSRIKPRLNEIGTYTSYQLAIGRNGVLWLQHAKLQSTMILKNLLQAIGKGVSQDKIAVMLQMLK